MKKLQRPNGEKLQVGGRRSAELALEALLHILQKTGALFTFNKMCNHICIYICMYVYRLLLYIYIYNEYL